MRSTSLKIIFNFILIFTLAAVCRFMFVKVFNKPAVKTLDTITLPIILRHEEIDVMRNGLTFKKPIFNNKNINSYIDNYINKNSCVYLDYNLYEFNEDYISIFLNCGNPKNVIFNYIKNEDVQFSYLINDETSFRENELKLLKLKYPKFVVDDINFDKVVYNLKENEIVGYYKTNSYGDVSIKINNNEIKNLLNYEMKYDIFYENEIFKLDPSKKTVAFTFDDGPSNYDITLSKYLAENHSKATFFIVGNRIGNFPSAIKSLIDTNMEIGNHTYSHKELTSINNDNVRSQVDKTNSIFYNLTGKSIQLFRAPYGSINKRVLNQIRMPSILWSLDTLDWQSRNADKVYEKIMNEVKDGDIILMHSLYPSTVEAVKKVVPELYKNGYQIVSVSELAQVKGLTLSTGSSYLMLK